MGAALQLKPETIVKNITKVAGTVKAHEFFSSSNELMGYRKGMEIYTAAHAKVAYVRGDNIYGINNKKMISLNDAQDLVGGDHDEITLAGLWYFFARPRQPSI